MLPSGIEPKTFPFYQNLKPLFLVGTMYITLSESNSCLISPNRRVLCLSTCLVFHSTRQKADRLLRIPYLNTCLHGFYNFSFDKFSTDITSFVSSFIFLSSSSSFGWMPGLVFELSHTPFIWTLHFRFPLIYPN